MVDAGWFHQHRLFASLDLWLKRSGRFYPLFIALLCCMGWALVTEVVRAVGFGGFYGVPLALSAVVVAAWVAGLWSGLITGAVSVLLLRELLPSVRALDVQSESLWHLTVFSVVAIIMSSFEASLRNQRQRELREKESRDEFLTVVSHELRTPLTVISGSANLLSRLWDSLSLEDREELLVDLQDESLRMTRMIDDLLMLGRIDAGAMPANEPLLLQPLVAQSMQSFRRLHDDRAVTIKGEQERLVIEGRETYIDAVLRNILSNAHRFSPEGAPIDIHVGSEGAMGVVRVRDHGPGVSEELLAEIYEPYVHTQPISDGTRGLGLGLALCKRAMEAMGGNISARSLREGGLEVRLAFRRVGSMSELAASVRGD